MNFVEVRCTFCKKRFKRPLGKYNEAVKKDWKQYCSLECQRKAKLRRIKKVCGNPKCNKTVFIKLNQYKKSKSGEIFCSRSCAGVVNVSNLPKSRPKIRICPICGSRYTGKTKYCSSKCIFKSQGVSRKQVINYIKKFYEKWGRLPLKREYSHYKRTRTLFGTWNKAVIKAGYDPNPVLFAKKFIVNDGHRCDSLSEKIVDDWLYTRKIEHRINVSYPKDKLLTVDFLVKNYWIEFFGLDGQLKAYDNLKKRKFKIAKKVNLDLIAIYPKDLFPKCSLDKILGFLIK